MFKYTTEANRSNDLKKIVKFINSPESGFVSIRGRRRVGKSWVIDKTHATFGAARGVFVFTGKEDQSGEYVFTSFAQHFDDFVSKFIPEHKDFPKLSQFGKHIISWELYFDVILKLAKYIQTQKQQNDTQPNLVLIFDEIQWIAKEKTGFIGTIKEYWNKLKDTTVTKIIICGSSNKFFEDNAGGEEQMLRGIATQSHIWINPFPLSELKKSFFPHWNTQELLLAYMFFGGIPYYLEQLDNRQGFISAINNACFCESTIFLQEIDEILRLEFLKNRREHIKDILKNITDQGNTFTSIIKKTKFSTGTVSEIISKLLDYGFLVEWSRYKEKSKRGTLAKFLRINDFYMAFYSQILSNIEKLIKKNTVNRNLFGEKIIDKSDTYYIPHFTGGAFERLVKHVLINFEGLDLHENSPKIFHKLNLSSPEFEVVSNLITEEYFDLKVINEKKREINIIECKWGKENNNWISQIKNKNLIAQDNYTIKQVIVCGYDISKSFQKKLKENGIIYIAAEDLF